MNVLRAILACSLYPDDALVRAIVDNAYDNPLAIPTPELDPETGATASAPASPEATVAALRESRSMSHGSTGAAISSHGGQAPLGLRQVPIAWAADFGREPAELFDPCVNVSIGTSMLSEFDYACARTAAAPAAAKAALVADPSRRACALGPYAQAIRVPELTTVVLLALCYQRSIGCARRSYPPPALPSRAWGSDCTFLRTREERTRP